MKIFEEIKLSYSKRRGLENLNFQVFNSIRLVKKGCSGYFRVYSWGWGVHGQLGHGDTDERLVPTPVTALDSQFIVKIAAGYGHSLILNKQVNYELISENVFIAIYLPKIHLQLW